MASTIDRSVPATNADLESKPVRDNFGAAANDVEALQSDVGSKAEQSALDAHTGAANPHSGSASSTDLSNHTGAANPHSGSLGTAHEGAGGAVHAAATTGANGFMSSTDKTKLDGVDTGANNYSHPNHTGDVTSSGDGAQTIANDAVTNAKLANVSANTIKGRASTTGDPTDINIEALADGGTPAAADVVLGKKQSGDLVKFLGANLGGGGGSGTYNEATKDGASISTGRAILEFRDTGDATVTVTDDGANDRTIVSIDATAGAGGGGITAGTPFVVGDILQVESDAGDGTAQTTGVSGATLTGHLGSGDIHVDHTAVSITAGDGLTGGGTIAATRSLAVDATVARLNAAADFTVSLAENGIEAIWSAFTAAYDGSALNFTPGQTPHLQVSGAVTINPPASGEGVAAVLCTSASSPTISGSFTNVIGTRTAAKAQTATMARVGTDTWWIWGPAAA